MLLILLLLLAGSYVLQDKKIGKGSDTTVTYELVNNWLKLPDNVKLGNPTGIGLDTSGNLFIFQRANREWPLLGSMPGTFIKDKTIFMVDKESGKLVSSWGDNFFIMPHGLTVDSNNNIWVTDVGLHQVFKFSHEGQLLMELGEAKASGNDKKHFNRPTDVAIGNDGSIYVSDGYGNSRIVKFAANGEYLFEWGKNGNRAGEFDLPHGVDIDLNGNVYVADRENCRIQVFDPTGKYLKQVADNSFGNIFSVAVDKTGNIIYAVDDLSFLKIKHRGSDIFCIDSTGIVQTRFGRSGSYSGQAGWYHDIAVDNQQNIFVGDILGNRVEKFKKISSH